MQETTIGTIALEHAEIVTANEIRYNDIHCDVGFVTATTGDRSAMIYLCRRALTLTEN